MTRKQEKPQKRVFWNLFWSFFKIGLFTFGGGYAMIPLIQREFSHSRKWIKKEEFLELLTLAQSAPGPIALNTSVFMGYKMAGYRGALIAVLGVVLPSFSVILVIAIFLNEFKHMPAVEAIFKGLAPCVAALIIVPLFDLSKGAGWKKIAVAAVIAFMAWKLPVSPVYYLIAGAIGGIVYMLHRKRGEAGK